MPRRALGLAVALLWLADAGCSSLGTFGSVVANQERMNLASTCLDYLPNEQDLVSMLETNQFTARYLVNGLPVTFPAT